MRVPTHTAQAGREGGFRTFLNRLEYSASQPPYLLTQARWSVHRSVQLVRWFRRMRLLRFKGPPAHVSTPFGAGHQARYPASYPLTSGRSSRPCGQTVSCCLSAAGVRFLGTLSCQTEFRPHYCRPTATGAHTGTPTTDPGRVYTFHTRETRTGPGALFTPGMTVFAGHRVVRGCRLPPHSGRPLPPRYIYPTRGVGFTRHQQDVSG
jgi:hypothetical protein